jgi:hypothetical protein
MNRCGTRRVTTMATQQCSHCSASVPAAARFCPRCGHDVGSAVSGAVSPPRAAGDKPADNRASGALPSSSPMPLAGILFLVAAVLGPTMIAVGVSTGNPVLLLGGVAIAVGLIVLLLLGMVC